jgi:hypothetical protein
MRIVLLTDKYFPVPLANGICVNNLVEVFVSNSHFTHLIYYKDIHKPFTSPDLYPKNLVLHPINISLRLNLFYYLIDNPYSFISRLITPFAYFYSKLIRILYYPFYPITSFKIINNFLSELNRIHLNNNIDLIISTFEPFEALIASLRFKRINKNVKLIVYSIDDLDSSLKRSSFKYSRERTVTYWYKKIFSITDYFIVMKPNYYKLSDEIKLQYKKKILISDLPLFKPLEISSSLVDLNKINFDLNMENWVYAGSLNSEHYDLSYFIRIFQKLSNQHGRTFHIFGRGRDFQKIKKISEKSNGKIILHGYLDYKSLNYILMNSNVLVSVKNSDQISAKIFSYFSYNKKVIHFSSNENDPDVSYVNSFNNGLVVKSYEKNDNYWLNTISNFLNSQGVRTLVTNNFEMNQPKFTYDLIIKNYNQL